MNKQQNNNQKLPKIAVVAAGTGGHIFPGLAIADVLREMGGEVFWVGTPKGIENNIVPVKGYELYSLNFAGLRGKGLLSWFSLPWRLLVAIKDALKIINHHKPQLILGMGGYITFPMAIAAKLSNVKLVVHEQNFLAGTANKYIAPIANLRLCGFNNSLTNSLHVGNPVNKGFFDLQNPKVRAQNRDEQKLPLQIAVLGGSLGALALNNILPKALSLVEKAQSQIKINVIHQCGNAHIQATEDNYQNENFTQNITYQVIKFIDDMPKFMADCDLLICRSGAQTVSEVAASGVAAIFVPFPFAIDDHQTFNAKYLSDSGAATLFKQKDLDEQKLANRIIELSRAQLAEIGNKARGFAMADAARKCAQTIWQLLGITAEVNNET